jgi:hypothetical protein
MATPGQAVPGTVVTSGAATVPAGAQGTIGVTGLTGAPGAQGAPGSPASTTTSGSFTVPAVGATTTVTVGDASWITVGQMVYVANAGGSSLAGALQVTAKTGNQLTLLNASPPGGIPLATTAVPGLLNSLSGNATDYVNGTNACQPLAPVIWSVRSRSYNAIGNPNFEVNQRGWAIGAPVLPANGAFLVDRWSVSRSATISATFTIGASAGTIVAPGSNFMLGGQVLVIQLGAQQTTLAAGDYFVVQQTIEGSAFRELQQDVHSLSLLINTNAALNFSVSLRNSGNTSSLVIPVSAPSGVSLLTFSNLPVWPGSAFSNITQGTVGYTLSVCLAAGSTFIAPATGSWQSGNYLGASGMDNFLAKPVGNNLVLSFIQHESGSQCSSLLDKPFVQNYDECLRYFSRSYDYGVAVGTNLANSYFSLLCPGTVQYFLGWVPFPKRMAKVPTVTIYSYTGAINNINTVSGDKPVSGAVGLGTGGFGQVNTTAAAAAFSYGQGQFVADTGW